MDPRTRAFRCSYSIRKKLSRVRAFGDGAILKSSKAYFKVVEKIETKFHENLYVFRMNVEKNRLKILLFVGGTKK